MEATTTTLESQIIEQIKAESNFQKEGLAAFTALGIPEKKSEAYKFTPIKSILSKNFDWSTRGEFNAQVNFEDAFYPVENANHLVFLNGVYSHKDSKLQADDNSMTIKAVDLTHEVHAAFGSVADQKNDAFTAWNSANSTAALHIEVSKNKQGTPTFIYHFVDSENQETYAFPRIFVKSNTGSELSIYEKLVVKGDHKAFINSTIEANVDANASLKYTKTQNYPSNIFAVEGIFAKQDTSSRFYTNTFSFSGAVIRNNIVIAIDGENCEGHMNGIYLIDGKTHVDNNTAVDHKAPNTYSNELYKGILKGQSKGVFNGKIYVRPAAQKTNAFQANNNVLLSENATINTKPQLEIWADDVKCSHGCTVGQLDEDAIFYLRARGISKDDAISLVLNAFTKDTLNQVDEELIKENILELIEKGLKNG
ncbi:MAG: Fe-S cluster assembly protein SufD [Cyclobacteriaceae bacterium]